DRHDDHRRGGRLLGPVRGGGARGHLGAPRGHAAAHEPFAPRRAAPRPGRGHRLPHAGACAGRRL
ncbi:MAG: hypothetical protein AVDCRST_MAG54-3344, partial [uncultured Actinomycetospora sp.]